LISGIMVNTSIWISISNWMSDWGLAYPSLSSIGYHFLLG
jgi:hypothetical protein